MQQKYLSNSSINCKKATFILTGAFEKHAYVFKLDTCEKLEQRIK